VKYCQSAKKLKNFFLQILVLIASISNFNYKNQEKIFLKKSLKHMWQHQIHALEVYSQTNSLYEQYLTRTPV
jgi:hypothetical protein